MLSECIMLVRGFAGRVGSNFVSVTKALEALHKSSEIILQDDVYQLNTLFSVQKQTGI